MTAILLSIASVWASLAGFVVRPTSARCPAPLWLATGVQPDGRFGCWASHELDGDTPDGASSYDGVLWSRVWCERAGDARQNGVTVWCAGGSRS